MLVSARTILLLSLLSFSLTLFAQKNTGRITGVLVSDSSRQQVGNATITLLRKQDSTVEKIVISDNKGRFLLSELKPSAYELIISDINHEPFTKTVILSEDRPQVQLDTIILQLKLNSMEMITIVRQLPVLIKRDTIEYNASSFKAKENDMAEDLLKRLPGLEVGRDGTITAQGEKITRVLVDGKPFFGNDPKLATQNIPANIIDKVQVIDEKSDQARVTKVDDGQVEKVINITIKKNRNRGSFGRGYLAYGTADRYESRVNANYFNDAKKMAIVAGSNNTGRADYGTGNNEEGSSYNNNSGSTRDITSRFTYSDNWGKKLVANGNFGYSDNRNQTDQVRRRQTLLNDSTNAYFESGSSKRTRSGVGGGIYLEYKPDTIWRFMLNQTVNFYTTTYHSASTFQSDVASIRKLNEGNRDNNNKSSTPGFNGNMTISRAFHKEGRGLFFNISDNFSNSLSDGFNLSNNYFYPLTEPEYDRIVNQYQNTQYRSAMVNSSISYSEPLGENDDISASYSWNYNKNNTLRETFDFNDLSNIYDLLNDSLTSRFNSYNTSSSAGITYTHSLKKGNLSIGSTWQNGKTVSRSVSNDSVFEQRFSGLVPFASYSFSTKGKRINISYNYSSRPPQAYQLQPVIDISNPLYVRLGNPGLKYTTIHRLNYSFNYYHQKSGFSLNSGANFNAVGNNISNSTSYDKSTGVQTTVPVNVKGVYSGNVRLNAYRPVKIFGNKNRFFVNTGLNYSRNVSLLDGSRNINHSINQTINAGIELEFKEFAELRLGYTFNGMMVHYSLRQEQNNKTNTQGLSTYLNITPSKSVDIGISWDYTRNEGSYQGFNRSINLVNADFTEYLGKKRNYWLKFKVYDLLKQNVNIYRYSGENFFEDVETNSLTRYFLVSFNMKVNKFKTQK